MFISEKDKKILCDIELEFLRIIRDNYFNKNEEGETYLEEDNEEGTRLYNMWADYWNVLERLFTKNGKLRDLLKESEKEEDKNE